ncbi:DnaJ homolog subfamily B member 7, partial [Durusdinium trenchii]
EAEQRFREVAEAYEVLSNADRRRQYDAGQMDGGQGGFGGFDFPDFGNFGFDFTDPKDLFKEMFGSEDPFADFHKFFDDVQFEEFGMGGETKGDSMAQLEQALSKFYVSVGQPEKASVEQIRSVLQMEKWKGREQKMFSSLQKKYAEAQYQSHLAELKKA